MPAFKQREDDAFKALSGVMSASIARRHELMSQTTDCLVFIFPAVILDGGLFECKLNENGEISATEIEEARVYLPMQFGQHAGTCVHVA